MDIQLVRAFLEDADKIWKMQVESFMSLYEKYQALTAGMSRFYLLGRLAEYKYYNIDAMTKKAMDLAEQIMKR